MADQRDAEPNQVLSRQVRQDVSVDFVSRNAGAYCSSPTRVATPLCHAVILGSEERQAPHGQG